MSTLKFNTSDVKKLVDFTKGKPCNKKHYDQPVKEKEFLYLVHDMGVYLMSGAKEKLPGDNGFHHVVYAEGCHPKKDEDWYDTARHLVGGDDFSEVLPLTAFSGVTDMAKPPNKVAIRLTETTVLVRGMTR